MRKGLSAVYGFIVIYLLVMAGLSAISNVASSQASLEQSVDRARQLDSLRSSEHLDLERSNGTLMVENDGSVLSSLQDIVFRTSEGTSVKDIDYQLPAGANASFPVGSGGGNIGVLTRYGNLFWASTDSPGSSCSNGTYTVDVSVSPSGSGTVSPSGDSLVCKGNSVLLEATAASGYDFAGWSGKGTGSYTGPGNPVSMLPGGDVNESAEFAAVLTIVSLTPDSDGVSSGGPVRQSTVVVAGPPQEVSLTALGVPPGVSVTFSPSSFTVSMDGDASTMSVSFSGTDYGVFSLAVLASGSEGDRANITYVLQTTPPDGEYVATDHFLSLYGIGHPREQKVAYWKGVYFMSFAETLDTGRSDTDLPIYYSGGWVEGSPGSMGPYPFYGYDFNLAQNSNQVLKTAVSYGGAELCYNLGVVGGDAIYWDYNGAGCEGPETPTEYNVVAFASGLVDAQGNWWAAVETQDPDHGFHFEVLTATNGGWADVYVSPSFGPGAQPVPELSELQDGRVVVTYTTFTFDSSCSSGDYFISTDDGGYTWSQPQGPLEASGSSLCYDNSSVTSVGDTLYAGGVDSASNLAYWSYDFDTSALYSTTLKQGVAYAALGSTGSVLTMAYSTTTPCDGQDSLYLMWSHDGGADWSSSGLLGCTHDYLIVPSGFQTMQVLIESDALWDGGMSPECFLFTV